MPKTHFTHLTNYVYNWGVNKKGGTPMGTLTGIAAIITSLAALIKALASLIEALKRKDES